MRVVMLSILLFAAQLSAEPLRLLTHDLPPYSFIDERGKADGLAIRPVQCALEKMGVDFSIQFVPWKRAQSMVQEGIADAFFGASRSAERDAYATLSTTIAPQEWCWFLLTGNASDPRSEEFRAHSKVSSFIGANMQDWLQQNGYHAEVVPATNQQLLQMLLSKRLDAILANNLVMTELLRENNAEADVRSVLQLDKPLGVYFSHRALKALPGNFIERFNRAVEACQRST
ncbi:substrate-binding periplasmic protein [Metapseudomonas otitidis]|uniref:substrate-binding periplasmic protein n=1 Tax=Metapseudomonas otitidis TaxID=319939 RepID=UPI001AAFEE5A|nr:transporter substrate-binding domain-containing protein [Pseudomonas otitidis]MBO2927736.1 transporter substrate-binding domain-containing protein [Pseudomonas otitidis]